MQPYMSCYSYLSTTQDNSSLETCKKENCIYVLCFGQKLVGFLATMSQCICSFIFAEWLYDEERGRGRKEKLSQLFGIRTTNQSNQSGNSPVSGVLWNLLKLNNLSEVGMFVPKLSPSILVYLFTELFYKDPSKNISVMKDDHCHCIIVVVSLNVCFLVI